MDDKVRSVWSRILSCLGEHASTLSLRPGASDAQIAEAEVALGVELPPDYRAWLRLHDGQDHVENQIEWLPAGGRLLPLAVTVARWRDEQEWVEPDDEGYQYEQDDMRIRCVVQHPRRIVVAGNQWGDGDNTYLDLIPGIAGTVGQVIVAVTECDFEVVGSSFLDFLERWAAAFEAGAITVTDCDGTKLVDLRHKPHPSSRWESALRSVAPLPSQTTPS